MKIRNIYFGKRIPFFCIAVTVLCIVVTPPLLVVYYFYVFFKNDFTAFANSSGRCP